ncbi:peptide deformylase [Oscillospiraceae bacterium CM]|nr:peptide deformylase [Oscillospiraceae bacterium CM]
MSVLNILTAESSGLLRKKAEKVRSVNTSIITLLNDLTETLEAHQAVGLSAPQVGSPQRLIVVKNESSHLLFINPVIIRSDGRQVSFEGCLSLPGLYGKVKRPENIVVRALNTKGKPYEMAASGRLACVLCHEIDHLDGVLFTDKVLPSSLISVRRQAARR